MNDLLLIPVIFQQQEEFSFFYGGSSLLPVDFSLLVLSVFLFSWRSMEFICSLQRPNFTRKIQHRMDYLVLRLSLSSLTLLCLSWQAGQGISGRGIITFQQINAIFGEFFIFGIFLSIIFMLGTVLVIYYKSLRIMKTANALSSCKIQVQIKSKSWENILYPKVTRYKELLMRIRWWRVNQSLLAQLN